MARRKRNKKQDETLVNIVEARDQAQNFFDRNQQFIVGAVLVVVLIAGGIFAYNNFYVKPRQTEAIQQMFQAEVQFQQDSFVQALTNPGGGYKGFLDITEDYSGTPAANLANYYAGVSYLNIGEYEAAISYLKDFKPDGEIGPVMKYGTLGDAYSELNDLDQAMSYYEKAANAEDNDLLTPYYLKKIGLLNEYQQNYPDALEAYQEIKDNYPQSTEARDIDKFIQRAAQAQG